MNIKTETWCGHKIRFVEKEGEWWAVLADVADALTLHRDKLVQRLSKDVLSKYPLETTGGTHEMLIVNEYGIYEAVFESRKKTAKDFKKWVFGVIKTLRQASGLEGFQVFRMMDKEHQKEAMKFLDDGLGKANDVDYYKANTVANKATSNFYGKPKQIKKDDMPHEWLEKRQRILEDVVQLMVVNKKFGLGVSISKTIYEKYRAS